MYNSANATAASDSIAFSLYQHTANLLKAEKNYNAFLSDSYLKCGILKMSVDEQEQALFFFREAIASVFKGNHLPDSLLFKPYLYAGSIQYNLNNLDSAKYYYSQAEAINNANPAIDESERLFNKTGALYYETGDYKKSIRYFEKALSVVENKKNPNVFFIVNYKNNIATAYLKLQEYAKALEIFHSILPYQIAQNELYYNVANAYSDERDYTKALYFFRQIKEMDHEKFNGIAKVFLLQKNFDSAGTYISKAANIFFEKRNAVRKINYGITLKYSGDLKAATGKPLEALTDYQHAINFLDPVFSDTSISSNPVSFSGLQNFSLLFDALVAKASAFEALQNQQPGGNYLQHSLNAYASAIALAKHIERVYLSDDARLFLKNKVNPATQQAVAAATRLFNQSKNTQYLQMAFGFAEYNKASVLQAGLQQLELSAMPGLPFNLLADEKKYKSLVAKLGIQINQAKDSLALLKLQKESQEAEINLTAVQEKLDADTLYHQLKFYKGFASIDTIQHTIAAKKEGILSYYYTADSLLCFYITGTESGYSAVPLKAGFLLSIVSLRKQLENPQASDRNSLQQISTALFDELIAPIFEKIKSKRHLVIIPYNEISYVPFEMLSDPKDGSLLLNKFSISYNYAANLLPDKKSSTAPGYEVLAMAPFSEANAGALVLPSLPSSGEEVNDLPGKKIAGAEATKRQFTTLSEMYPVIHLATHAVVNDTNALGSYIEFYGSKNDADTSHRLYETEIYNLDMKAAKLVILSACETGNGLLVNGEGVMSLSRAFSYAGCKSVITSLWKADDFATAFIIKRLHHHLQNGLAKDDALQKAKIDYLKSNAVESRFKTPAYWAHLILIGDQQALVVAGLNWYIITGVTAMFILLVLYLYKKNTGQK